LGVGFGSGWTLSQRSAKKGFKAAMEQQSLENSPRQASAQPSSQKPPIIAPKSPDSQQQPLPEGSQTLPTASGTQAISDPQLSFYKNLPSGQQNNVLGSGINSKDDKTAKQPLQAAIPTNLTKPPQPQNANENAKSPTPAAVEKTTVRQDANANVFTVQVASLSLKSEAETLKNKLAGKGYNVYIAESNQGNKGTWYRVRVGRGLEQDSAKELAGKLGRGAMAIPEKD
jgi:cell division septation protein DedD